MKLSRNGRKGRSAARSIEILENRVLLSATVLTQIPTQTATVGQAAPAISLSTYLNDPAITGGTVVEMQTPLGNILLQLTDSQTPLTVANFVQYINNGEYTPTIVQRSAPGFVLQGGGTKPDGSNNVPVSTLQSEAGIPNTPGTIAMALSTGPDSGTNQWFINLGDNSSTLDGTTYGGPFTVFGNVIDGGMNVADAIAQLPIINGSAENGNWYIGTDDGLPVINYSGSSTPATVPQSNLVTDNVVVIPGAQAAPTYSAVSANPSLLTASVSNGVLTLTPVSSTASGTTTVTATVTDLAGETASSTFTVNVVGPPSVSIANATGTVGAGNQVVFPVTLSPASTSTTTFQYTLTSGSAPSTDFQATDSSITIPAGSTQASIPVNIIGDPSNAAESFTITLSSLSSNAFFPGGSSTEQATGTIMPPQALTPVISKSTLPTSTVAGTAVHGGATVQLTNATQTVESGTATVKLYASLDGVIDSSAFLVTTLKHAVHLKVGKSVSIHVTAKSLPSTLPSGAYTLLVQTTDAVGNITDASSGPAIQVAAPFVSLSASNPSITPSAIKLGKGGSFTVTLTNNGNVASSGAASISIGLTLDDETEALTLSDISKSLKINANKSLVLHLHFVVPPTATAEPYKPFVSITDDGSTATAVGTKLTTLET